MKYWNRAVTRRASCLTGIAVALCLLVITPSSENHLALFRASAQAQGAGSQNPVPPHENPRTGQQTEPTLMVAGKFTGNNEPEGIKLTAETGDFKHVFQISAITDQEVKDLRVEVAPFTGPNSAQREIVWKLNNESGSKPVTVPGLNSIPLELSASLPIAGPYSTNIWLTYNKRRWPIALTVTRTRVVPSVEILGLETARDSAFMPSENAYLWFNLHEKAGKRVSLNMPTLAELALVQADKTKLQASYDSVRVECASADCTQNGNSLELGAGKTVRLKLTVINLKDSGEFSGKLRVSGADGEPLDQAVTILRKKSGLLAGLLIALGVFISFALRHYASSVRPRLILQREVVAIKEDIDELKRVHTALTVDEQEVLDKLNNQTQDLGDEIAFAKVDNVQQEIKNITSKVEIFPRWVQERGRVDALKPIELQQEFRNELDKIKKFMNTEPITDELLTEARTTLNQIPPQMKSKVKEDLAIKVNALKTEVDTHRSSATADTQTRLSQEVDPEIRKVEELLKSENVDDARTAYETARLAFVRILSVELESSLPANTPTGFDEAGWQALKAEVLNALTESGNATDPDKAKELYLNAYSQYLKGLTSKLQGILKARQESVEQNSSTSPADKAKFQLLLTGASTSLTTALSKIDAADVRGAAQDYEAARKALVDVDKELEKAGGTMAATVESAAEVTAAVSPGSVPGPLNLPFLGAFINRTRTTTVREITRKLGLLDLLFTAIILLIAVFMGLKLLWLDNPTWGGWDAYLSAVLWGLGLHQVSGAAFEGLQGLAAKFSPST